MLEFLQIHFTLNPVFHIGIQSQTDTLTCLYLKIMKSCYEYLQWIFIQWTHHCYIVTIISRTSIYFFGTTLDVENTHGILDMWKDVACNLWSLGIDFTRYFMTILINSNQSCSFFLWRVFNLILSNACTNGPRKLGA